VLHQLDLYCVYAWFEEEETNIIETRKKERSEYRKKERKEERKKEGESSVSFSRPILIGIISTKAYQSYHSY
jgi:hypothetical protein